MTDIVVKVDSAEFRVALLAAIPHSGTDPDYAKWHRVRVYVGPGELLVTASDGMSTGMAALTADVDSELGVFDLLPQDVRELLALFKPAKDTQQLLEIHHTGKTFEVEDVSGLFPGKAARWDGIAVHEEWPDVPRLMRSALRWAGEGSALFPDATHLLLSSHLLARFVASAKPYGGTAIRVHAIGVQRPMLVLSTASGSFKGLLTPIAEWVDNHTVRRDREETDSWVATTSWASAMHPTKAATESRDTSTDLPTVDLADILAGPDADNETATEEITDEEEG